MSSILAATLRPWRGRSTVELAGKYTQIPHSMEYWSIERGFFDHHKEHYLPFLHGEREQPAADFQTCSLPLFLWTTKIAMLNCLNQQTARRRFRSIVIPKPSNL